MAQRKKKAKQKPAPAREAAPGGATPEAGEGAERAAEPSKKVEPSPSPGPGGTPTPSDDHPYAGLVFVGVIMGLILLAIATQLVMD